ncbi:hypothetical protein [Streptomyces sp. Z26]|uniref:hypothetical protein n=1 Tax=Streptomyces sp. Z26 TaxID=2500177 RepID=UPI001F0C2B79|nr:hypothetical protein [Streptomyces sp. Z26]
MQLAADNLVLRKVSVMDIVLDPPDGITGFPTGMPADEVKAAAAELGQVKVKDEGSDA